MDMKYVLLGMVLPFVISGGLFLSLGRSWKGRPAGDSAKGGWAAAVALAVGYGVGQAGVSGRFPLPPRERYEWLMYLGAAGCVVAALDRAGRVWRWLLWLGRAFLALVFLWILTRPYIRNKWGVGEASAWLAGLGMALLVTWGSMEAVYRKSVAPGLPQAWPDRMFPWALVLAGGGGAVVLGLSGSFKFALLAGALTAALAAQAVVVWLWPFRGWISWVLPVFLILLPGLWLVGYIYAALDWRAAGLLVLSLHGVWASRMMPGWRTGESKGAWLGALAGVVVCLIGAVAIAQATSSPFPY